jgi:ferrochelatase
LRKARALRQDPAVSFSDAPSFRHESTERIGILLVNSGTPDSTSTRDVRRFLGRLLGDPRVVELPRILWLPLLHGIILRTRPFRSARKYRAIWTAAGSPLIEHSLQLRAALADELGHRVLGPLAVEVGMLYANPGVDAALRRLRELDCRRIVVLPMFPQYCCATTASVFDQVSAELARWRWIPELRFIADYHEHPGYIRALATSVAEHWERHGRTRHLQMSFHGIPEQYFRRGDPYFCKCQKTARLLAEELDLRPEDWGVSFQSRYGPGSWLKPYSEDVLRQLARRGVRSVSVICPGFSADCLESLEEVDIEFRRVFLDAGGERFDYIPALNARPDHARAIADLLAQQLQGWTDTNVSWLAPATLAR